MGGFFKKFSSLVRNFDLFPSGQFLRYKNQPNYQTTTGGVVSILIMTVFIALFASTALKTVSMELITSTQTIEKQFSPDSTEITFTPDGGFMFALALSIERASGMLNLNNPNVKYFDLELTHWVKQPDYSYVPTDLPLTMCTDEHFKQYPELTKEFPPGIISIMACPAFNSTFTLQGARVTSDTSYITLTIKKCNMTKNSNCISDQGLIELQSESKGGKFQALLLMMSNNVSPESKNYKSPYIDSRRMLSFTLSDGLQTDLYIEQSIVVTDESLTPLEDTKQQSILTVEDYVLTRPTSTQTGDYLLIRIGKSPYHHTYYRRFQKVDEFFSYVGGLIGIIIALLFILSIYSSQAYSVSIASQLYLSDDGAKIESSSFNIGYFLLIPFKKALDFICCCSVKWKMTDFYSQCINEADKQLDVLNLMKKIIFLEKALSLLFQEHQLEALYLFEKETIEEAQKKRKKYQLRSKLAGKTNKVTPINVEGAESGERPQVNDILNIEMPLHTDGQISGMSFSDVNPLSHQRLKSYIGTLVKESLEGNMLSSKIAKNIAPDFLATAGLEIESPTKRVQVKQQRVQQEESIDILKYKFKRRNLLEPLPGKGKPQMRSVKFVKEEQVESQEEPKEQQQSSSDNDD